MAAASIMAFPTRNFFQDSPQQYATYRSRTEQHHGDLAQSLTTNPSVSLLCTPHYPQQPRSQSRSPPMTNSPYSDYGFKPSLPPISNLLGIANNDRVVKDTAVEYQALQQQSHTSQPLVQAVQQIQQSPSASEASQTYPSTTLQQSPFHHPQEVPSSLKMAIPPPPLPFRNDSVIEGTNTPSTISSGSSLSSVQPFFLASALNNIEATDQRVTQHAFPIKRPSVPSHPSNSPYKNRTYTNSPYATSPGAISNASYYSSADPTYTGPGMLNQRPLPSNFPPPPTLLTDAANRGGVGEVQPSNPWEHHHYISPSSQANFPPSQDRYICPTCNKAFSRPSSLKIHSHSHTGEKPFKCPRMGCGKAFSVRSNMKRHERGCHAGDPGVIGAWRTE